MRAAVAVVWAGMVLGIGGCELLRQSPLRPQNQMPPPSPITYSQYHLAGWSWDSVARVVVLSPRNESDYTQAGQQFQDALASELQRLGRFEVVTAPFDDYTRLSSTAHQGGRFDEGVALEIARQTRADVLVYSTVTQYSPYPRPRLGVVVQAVSPVDGKVVGSVDGLWDTTDGGIAEQVRMFYRQRPKPLPTYVQNHAIVADDNFATELALDSPALFQRFVAHTVAGLLVQKDGDGQRTLGTDCLPCGDCSPLGRRPLILRR